MEDNGIGIADKHLASGLLFQPFFQVDHGLPAGERGVGLGLSIVHAALALMPDHEIGVESRLGEGSCFTLHLPHAPPPPASAPDDSGSLAASTDLTGKYLLLVDDDALIRRSIAALVDCRALVHDEFASLADLLARLATIERQPDVLVTDYKLPDNKTAFDIMACLATAWPGVPTVVVTGDAEAAASLPGQAGIVAVLHKPVSPEELIAALAIACRSGRATDH